MGTRCGDIDPALVIHLMACEDIGQNEVNTLLNKHSGLQGVSGVSNDMREVSEAAMDGNERAKIALDMFCYRIKKYVGAYLASMNGASTIVFTGGIGENQANIRESVCGSLSNLGVRIDAQLNEECRGSEANISADDSQTGVYIIPTNEEIVIARDTIACIDQEKA